MIDAFAPRGGEKSHNSSPIKRGLAKRNKRKEKLFEKKEGDEKTSGRCFEGVTHLGKR